MLLETSQSPALEPVPFASEIVADSVSAKAIIVTRNNKVLLLKKPTGKWDLPGGKLKRGEGWFGGLAREVFEESGLEIENPDWLTGWVKNSDSKHPKRTKRTLQGVFFCRLKLKPKQYALTISEEHVHAAFFSMKQIRTMMLPKRFALALSHAEQRMSA